MYERRLRTNVNNKSRRDEEQNKRSICGETDGSMGDVSDTHKHNVIEVKGELFMSPPGSLLLL